MNLLFISLGCDKNLVDTEKMLGILGGEGYSFVDDESDADVIVVNTCCFIGDAKEESVNTILEMAELKKSGRLKALIVTGCLAERYKNEITEEIPEVDAVLGTTSYEEIAGAIREALKGEKTLVFKDIDAPVGKETKRLVTTGGHYAFLKIAEGCDKRCTYCIIPYARGRVRSRKKEDVVEEVRTLAEHGYQEVVLTGIHLSSYGLEWKDENGKQTEGLLDLIRAVHGVEGIKRIRLGSLEPRIVTEEFAKELACLPKICPHFHLSLQSGCNETLKRMNRHYTAEEYYEKVQILRKYFEHPAITTDVIVGFPGETAEEFAVTKTFLEKVHFFEMHIFKYSRRKGTVADKLPGQLTDAQKTERSGQLLALEKEQSREFRAHYLGQEVEVLIEEQKEIGGKVYWLGHTDTYVKAAFAADSAECMDYSNRLVHGRAVSFLSDEVLEIALNF